VKTQSDFKTLDRLELSGKLIGGGPAARSARLLGSSVFEPDAGNVTG